MKPKRSKKQKLFELWVFFFPLLYLLLLPALFAYYPGAVTAWLDACHILFGDLPNIAAFLYEAEYMVNKHGLSMPHTFYIHGFWICFAALSLSLYGLLRVLKVNDSWLSGIDKIGFATRTGWIGKDDGFLIYNKDSDNRVTATDEVSFIFYVSGAKTDLEGLKHFDSNNDGKLTSADTE